MTARNLLTWMLKTFLITIPVIQEILSVAMEASVITVLMADKRRSDVKGTTSAAFWFLGKHEYSKWACSFITGFCTAGGIAGLYSYK